MKVEKKELVERQFTPYQITISIESEEEHKNLSKDIDNYRDNHNFFSRVFGGKSAVEDLFNIILQHKK